MDYWFVTMDGSLKARWQKAFPDAQPSTPDSIEQNAQSGDLVWIATTVASWPQLTQRLALMGATVVILSYAPQHKEALKALDLGGRGYAHTLATADVLKQVALVVTNQGVWVGQELLAKVIGGTFKALTQRTEKVSSADSDSLALLTERERGVALAVARGATNKEVARQLDITERTVKAHLSAIFKKLAVRDRLQLMLKLSSTRELASY
ncbi:response regulator transcription factor [Vreelandella maris]|uniref:Response regulator transcription factor n=1 Tax=Vreelandella maris TaxID=2729617 RepID=A0A7Y6V733_9GAMM|nr:response regulator transcription factor [Halomonas maris]NVF12824.1 response regulator transcription factor [Halomonas maris]|tara:strand:- start:1126 stop:1752 length:627 start_codon:yes stop_codon:yes gene_type:complete